MEEAEEKLRELSTKKRHSVAKERLLEALVDESEIPWEVITGKLNINSSIIRGLEKDEYLEDIFPNCEPNGNAVLQIYCHNDGYPEGVGYALIKGYNSYEKALALILGGDLSSLYKSHSCPYSLGKGEDPIQCAPDVLEKAEIKECFLYVFDYETNKWLIQKHDSELKPLEDALK